MKKNLEKLTFFVIISIGEYFKLYKTQTNKKIGGTFMNIALMAHDEKKGTYGSVLHSILRNFV